MENARRYEAQFLAEVDGAQVGDDWVAALEKEVVRRAIEGDAAVQVRPHGAGFHLFFEFDFTVGYEFETGEEIRFVRVEVTSPFAVHAHPRRP